MSLNLFDPAFASSPEQIKEDAYILRGRALTDEQALLATIEQILLAAPLRHMLTPGGHTMSVAMTNCGESGWVSDAKGYRYSPIDPFTQKPWPPMPEIIKELAESVAEETGLGPFHPDACLINCYEPGTKLSLHQDRDEEDLSAPIVSVSLGVPAIFLFGGLARADKTQRLQLLHGDVVIWGKSARLAFHGIMSIKQSYHQSFGERRFNLTLRKAK
jgi:alkylated DNA repair protein (DNA oxidative demethylase)